MMLDGLRVLALAASSRSTPDALGAFCGRILADLGADVVFSKWTEAPERRRPPLVGDESALFLAMNANKREATIEIDQIPRLAARADVIIQGQPLFDYAELAPENQRLILVTITPYGYGGPVTAAPASDLEITASSGSLWLAGEPGRAPVRTTAPQSPWWTGMYAAMGTLVALAARARTGRGQHVDVSAQACMATIHPPAIVFWETLREEHRRLGPYLIGRSIVGAKFRNIWPCRDGYVSFAIQGGPIGRHTGPMLADWMREKNALDEVVGAVDWDSFDNRTLSQAEVDRLEASVERFLRGLTKREFFAGVISRNILGYPVSDARGIFADEQLKARGFWGSLHVGGRAVACPGGFALFDGERPAVRAQAAEPAADVWSERGPGVSAAQWGGRGSRDSTAPVPGPREHDETTGTGSALSGVRVVELGWAAAGPLVGKYLANHGADVIHLETGTPLDPFRSTYPPFVGEPGPNTAAMFAFYNDGKRGATINLHHPKAA